MYFSVFLITISIVFNKADDTVSSLNGTSNVYSRLFTKLLTGYDKRVRPVSDPRKTLNVLTKFFPMHIEVSEKLQEINLAGFLTMQWNDEYLTWNPKEFDDVDTVRATEMDIWMPQTISYTEGYSGISGENSVFKPNYILVNNKGMVYLAAHVVYNGYCEMDFNHWPSNVLECSMYIGSDSLTHIGVEEVYYNYTNGTYFDSRYIRTNKEWDLLNFTATCERFAISSENQTICILSYSMILKRHKSIFYVTFMLPGAVLSALILVPFWMKGSRLIFQLFISFSQILFLINLSLALKSGSSDMLLARFFADTFLMNSFSMVLTILNTILLKCEVFPPKLVMRMVDTATRVPYVGQFFIYHIKTTYYLEDSESNFESLPNISRPSKIMEEWIQVIAVVDRFFFTVLTFMLLYFWIVLLL